MSELDDEIAKRIQEDLSKNPEYKLFMEQDNYISEEAAQYVYFILDYYVKYGGEASAANICSLFGMSESKAEAILKFVKK